MCSISSVAFLSLRYLDKNEMRSLDLNVLLGTEFDLHHQIDLSPDFGGVKSS